MADLGSYLRRFRRLMSPPGRPGPMAVPSDRVADTTDELAELLAAVDVIDQEARATLADAHDRAQRRREQGRLEADRIRREAQQQAEEERAAAAADQRSQLEDELQGLADAATHEAEEVRQAAADRLDDLAAEVAARVLAADPTTAPTTGPTTGHRAAA